VVDTIGDRCNGTQGYMSTYERPMLFVYGPVDCVRVRSLLECDDMRMTHVALRASFGFKDHAVKRPRSLITTIVWRRPFPATWLRFREPRLHYCPTKQDSSSSNRDQQPSCHLQLRLRFFPKQLQQVQLTARYLAISDQGSDPAWCKAACICRKP
jgi:hypothetical protein